MSIARWLVLTLGPFVIVGSSYWISKPEIRPPGDERADAAQRRPACSRPRVSEEACRKRGRELKAKLGPEFPIVVGAPYVLAGDISRRRLDGLLHDFVRPIDRALHTCYFDRRPTEPIVILALSDDAAYHKYARLFDGKSRARYSGYYRRGDRRIVLNLATGHGTLAHELTHALAAFDAPHLPEWFDEGLASLHEESRFSDDGLRLVGRPNWRGNYLKAALSGGRLPSLRALVQTRNIRGDREAVLYALSRYFCLYLQHRQLLAHYYRKLKRNADTDPTGRTALRELLHAETLDGVERDFRAWLVQTLK
ncbi:MAG: hypothetical protein ACE5KM_02530 [Planctomycetaceae bacterium]